MTGLGVTGNIVVILVLLLVIAMFAIVLRSWLEQTAASRRRKRADKGKVKCYGHNAYTGIDDAKFCNKKAGWVTPHGYFCEDHWEINSKRDGSGIRWAHLLAWKLKGD